MKRAELKSKTRSAIHAAKPSPVWVTLALLAILSVLNVLSMRISGEWDAYMKMASDWMTDGVITYVQPEGTASFYGALLSLALNIMSVMLSVGYIIYCLRVSRRARASFGDLFDSFGLFFRCLWMYILLDALIAVCSSVYIFPANYLAYATGDNWWFAALLPLLIPAVIAVYAYRQCFFLMLDNPTMSCMQCLQASRNIMHGHKWELFKLDLSFIGWILLCIIPFVNLWVMPYAMIAFATYYDALMEDYVGRTAPPVQPPENY